MSILFKFRVDRYIGFLLPLLFLLIAAGVVWGFEVLKRRLSAKGRAAFAGAVVFVVLYVVLAPWPRRVHTVLTSRTGVYDGIRYSEMGAAAETLRGRLREQDAVVTMSSLLVSHYLRRPVDYVLTDAFGSERASDEVPHYSGAARINGVPEMEAARRRHPRGWVVMQRTSWEDRFSLSEDLREFIRRHTRAESGPESVVIRSWGVP